MITKATFMGPGFTRKPPKYEPFIRPSGLRITKAHVTHPELKCTFNLEIIGVKKNPNGQMYTSFGVLTKGTIIDPSQSCVNVSELGLVTPNGKVVTNNPKNDAWMRKCSSTCLRGLTVELSGDSSDLALHASALSCDSQLAFTQNMALM
ncbi:putative ribosomal protein S8e/ribosomal biogenesis NSA2 [Rosa chinensis]|uniref:Putative ribosomal protein S8e/ribosomal biogenesis NSA2 n=1 Tax=Rosa chinensis TaxID=74649 RepID=A0A2P6PBT0_ROSCH|nr:putative ribosomal protein S8e/ribosomal biogenesis NSA2 [Rosa chinensis]